MGIITEDITRLVGEIQGGHRDRRQMMRDLGRSTAERKREVKEIQAGFHAAHAEMSRKQMKSLRNFTTGIENMVSGMLKGFSDDLEGGRRAWRGIRTRESKPFFAGTEMSQNIVPETKSAETRPVVGTTAMNEGSAKGVKGTRKAGKGRKKHRW